MKKLYNKIEGKKRLSIKNLCNLYWILF